MFSIRTSHIDEVQQKFATAFPDAVVSHRNAILSLVRKYQETGSVHDADRPSRPPTIAKIVVDTEESTEVRQAAVTM
ncbi:hypothetical protein ANN_11163 [Periplaneta americana]|uniref:DUF4817 domain-containing protein n=1 Tax=Periplaneta americana TaxID=6978 RepID=A0ABQ8T494_PERAM|nr:hypothetical protein ANN_11163 [Periplaneta americana]